jgi:hypothetical protein
MGTCGVQDGTSGVRVHAEQNSKSTIMLMGQDDAAMYALLFRVSARSAGVLSNSLCCGISGA